MKKTIESPFADCIANLTIRPNKMTFRKEEFDVFDYFYVCSETNREFTTSEATDITLKQLYNQYREIHNILFPLQIRQLREQYDLSPVRMSEVLGFGENVYRQYEKGEIPNKSNATVLNLIKEPENFIKLATESKLFSEVELNDLETKALELIKSAQKNMLKRLIRNYSDEIDQFTGYVLRYYKKFAHMIIYFLTNNERVFTTRLNKYMFYGDFLSYKYTGNSITGYNYCALPNGPVLDNYKRLLSELWEEHYVDTRDEVIENKEIERFVPIVAFDNSLFTTDEIEIMKYVSGIFKDKSTKEIIDISHSETGWKENEKNYNTISYQKYAPLINF